MGEVVETGSGSTLQKGQRVVVPFVIACGKCFFCEKQQYSACDNSNPVDKQDISETLYGHAMSGLFGYSHLTGGYPGGQAERSEEHTSELQSLMRTSYAVFCLKKKKTLYPHNKLQI